MPLLLWLSRTIATVASHPVVTRILFPAVTTAVMSWIDKQANRIETKAAINQAKAAQTAQELRDASRRLSDSTRR